MIRVPEIAPVNDVATFPEVSYASGVNVPENDLPSAPRITFSVMCVGPAGGPIAVGGFVGNALLPHAK